MFLLPIYLVKANAFAHVKLMRFVFAICMLATLVGTTQASPWDIVPLAQQAGNAPQPKLRAIQMQRGGSSDRLSTIDGLKISIAAKNLGYISAMTVGKNNTLYVADKKTGRIWALADRRQDGEIDQRRPLPMRFDNPSGLAVIGETLYVADQNAVWKLSPQKEPIQLASLANAESAGDVHALADAQDSQHLLLGLTTTDDNYRILQIDTWTGRAELLGKGAGRLHAVSNRKGAEPWVSINNTLHALSSAETALTFNPAQSISALALPGQYETPQDWAPQLRDHIFAAQIGPDAMRLIAIPTEFGQTSGDMRVLVDGFLSGSNRSAWGVPGPIIMDKRGLYFADTYSGTVWRLSSAPKDTKPETNTEPKREEPPPPEAGPEKSLLLSGSGVTGSQLGQGSTLDTASQLNVGSTQVEAYDKKKAEEAKAKAEEKKAKKTFRQR